LSNTEKIEILREAIVALYQNFIQLENKDSGRDLNKLIVFTKSNEFKPITHLFLSKDYGEIGASNQMIFKDIYQNSEYIAEPSIILGDEIKSESYNIEEFFIWLGINGLVKIKKDNFNDSSYYG